MNNTTRSRRPIPIYTTLGEFAAFLLYPMIYSLSGEWIGFVTQEKDVYSVAGEYVGWVGEGPRILRKRNYNFDKPKLTPPGIPPRMKSPASSPLAPMMSDLSYDTIDVMQDEPQKMHTIDAGEFRQDMD